MRQLIAILLLVTTFVLAGCGDGAAATPTITPIPVPTAASTAAPTVAPEPTAVPVATQPDAVAAVQAQADGRFEYAVALLNKVYGGNRESDEAAALLAEAYLSWARATVAQAGGSLEERAQTYSLALDRYTSGLALLALTDSNYGAMENEAAGFARFIEQYVGLVALIEGGGAGPAASRAAADDVIAGVTALRAEHPELPGGDLLASEAFIAAARVYGQTASEDQAGIELLRTARGFCEQAQELGGAGAGACISSLTQRIAGIQAALDRLIILQRPWRLAVRRKNQDEQPSCLSIRVLGIEPRGWILSIDGTNVRASFGGLDARTCAMQNRQEVTFTLFYPDGRVVPGGGGIKARGGDIFEGNWQQ